MHPPDWKTGVVLLAAGWGKRFGGDKLAAEFRGRPLWELAAEIAESLAFSERILVIGPNSPIIGRPGWTSIENPVAVNGMGTSIAAGVRALTDCDRVMILLADMPLVTRAHLGRLVEAQGVAFTRYPDDTGGCPAIFPRSMFARLGSLAGDRGARALQVADAELIAPAYEREIADVDTVRDLENLSSSIELAFDRVELVKDGGLQDLSD